MKYILLFALLFLISCSENKVTKNDIVGKWIVIEQKYNPYKLNYTNKTEKKLHDSLTTELNESFKKEEGKQMIFKGDSTYYSEQQPNHLSYWVLDENISEIKFSETKKPFVANYFIEKVILTKNTLLLEDKTKNAIIQIKLKKWQK
jgi:hypothetical protein